MTIERPRETQRIKLYKAETVLRKYAQPLPEITDIERYIKKVFQYAHLKRRYGDHLLRDIIVKDGRGCRNALAFGRFSIAIPLWARDTHIVLHEVAHIIAHRVYGTYKIAGHGWEYAGVYLEVVRAAMGVEAHNELKASFKKHKVRYTKPVKRQLTDEQREALRQRAIKMRELLPQK